MSNGQYPNYPGYPAPPAQPQQPQPQPQAQPQQPGYPAPPVQPGYSAQQPPTQPGYPAQQPPAMGLPTIHTPDEAYTAAEYERIRAEAARWGTGGGGLPFLKFPGPQGQLKWDASVPINYESRLMVYICPPWAPGRTIFKQVKSHFWKSAANPQGTSIGCPGPERCLICQAKDAAMAHPDPSVVERAKQFGRVRKQYLYNVINLEDLNGHYDQESGTWRPYILGAGAKLHGAIGDLVQERGGAMAIVDPQRGRPVRLKRRKTGHQQMDVEYGAVDLDPSPLPQQFYPILHNLHDLDRQERTPTHEDMVKAVTEMGLPLPAQHPGQFQPAPPPAYPSPYGQPPAQVGAQQAPTFMPPPADPMEFPPGSSGVDPAYQGMAGQPQQSQAPMMPPPMATPQSVPPPPPAMSPPPVQSQPGVQGAPYSPQPGQQVPPPPPVSPPPSQGVQGAPGGQPMPPPPAVTPPPAQAQPQQPMRQPVAAPAETPPQTLAFPLPSGTVLPGGRERCYGKFNGGDKMCQECPDWVKAQCQPISGAQAQPQGQPQDLTQLQNQLTGQGQG